MSEQTNYEKLGVTEDASFEEIQAAKNRLSEQHRNDSKVRESIEAAYDAIIMDRLKKRQEGKIKVPDRIRFPERQVETPSTPNSTPANSSPPWLQRVIDTPSRVDILIPAAIFLGLGGLTVIYPTSNGSSIVPVVMALGFGVCIYFLNRKENRFGRAILFTLVGLIAGITLGSVLFGVLATQLGGLNVEQFSTLVTFFVFWMISSFLR